MKNQINQNLIKKGFKTKEKDIYKIIEETEFINHYYKESIKDLDTIYLFTQKDIKLFHFFFKYLCQSHKYKDLQIFFVLKNKKIIASQNLDFQRVSQNSLQKIKYIIPKFINLCLLNHFEIAKCFHLNDKYFFDNILKITKIFFLNDFIDEKDLQMILFLQIILSLYNKNNQKEINIQNVEQIYLVIDYLLTFCSNNNYLMTNNKIRKFNQVIGYVIDKIDENILLNNNYSNMYTLAQNISFFRIIYLSQITSMILTPNITSKIIKILVKIYLFKLDINYVFEDLSEQFKYRTKKESLSSKTNLLMAKNQLLNDIFEKEKQIFKGEDVLIRNGFYFTDCPNNGIVCDSVNKFPNENDGYSIVISFRLMNDINKDDKNTHNIYTIFSLMNKDNNIFHFYIEDNKLKLRVKKDKKSKELYKISNNTNYVLWIIQSKLKSHKMILYLNNCKNIIDSISYPEGYYRINIGFSNCNNPNFISKDNFIGIIGTLIIFKKCLIKDENDNINITKLTELKGNYEDIIYVNCKREWGFIDKNINWILNKMENDINIYNDIDIIISTQSLGNLNLFYDKNNILGELKSDIYCNYFENSSLEVKYYFRNKNTLKDHLNFPTEFQNTFINYLNNHIFLYLQLELYYFISLLSFKISEANESKQETDKIYTNKIFENFSDQEDFYINLTNICSLFLFCIDTFNSITCLNNSQKNIFQNEIDNFKYTLYDLISIYSKYGCKINTYFLGLFVEKITKKKYFEYSVFILTFEFYDINNNEVFSVLFNYLSHISIEECDNSQIKTIFLKLIDFDKIYLSDNIKKDTKKEYSKIMRYLIKVSIDEKINECFSYYRKNLKKLKKEFERKNLNLYDEQKIEEEDIYTKNYKSFKKSKSDTLTNVKIKSRKSSLYNKFDDSKDKIELQNLDYLILIYKHLKNLYIGINTVKNKFIELCYNKQDSIYEFFNQLFYTLCQIYPIEDEEQALKFNESEKNNKEIILSELIKCLCIRFLDDLFFEENIKKIKEEEAKKQSNGEKNDENDSKKGNSGNLKNSFNSASIIRTNLKNSKIQKISFKKDGSSNNLISIANPLDNSKQSSFISNYTNVEIVTNENILMSKMEFFDTIILSQYTFKSFFLMLFRDIPNDKKLKIIKDDKYITRRFLMSEKHFFKTRYLLAIIILLIEKQNLEGYDTLFMSKIQLIEYCYDKFIDLLKNMLENYINSDSERKKKLKPIINTIFVDKRIFYDVNRFYEKMIINIISNFNGCLNNKPNLDFIKDCHEKFLIQIQNDIEEFMNNSLFELIDPFYFKLLAEIYFQNDKNNEYIISIVVKMIEKITTKMNKENKNRIIELNCKNILILLYKMIFYVRKRNLILFSENEIFLEKVILFLSNFIQHCNILYTKILFPIEESKSRLLMEILFEIIIEIHLEHLRNPKNKALENSTSLLKSLFNEEQITTNLSGVIKHKKSKNQNEDEVPEIYSPFYIMDKISYFKVSNNSSEKLKISDDITINKQFFELKDYILLYKYKDEYKDDKNLFSACILFCIKLILSIKELKEFYSNNKGNITSSIISHSSNSETNSDSKNKENENTMNLKEPNEDIFIIELKKQFINLAKNVLKIHKDHISSNPFKSIGYYAKNIYEYFRSFIVDQLSFSEGDPFLKIDELIERTSQYKSDLKIFGKVIYTKDGRTKLYTEKMYIQIMKTVKSEMEKDNESSESLNDKKSHISNEGSNSIKFGSLKGSFGTNSEKCFALSSNFNHITKTTSYDLKSQNNQGNNLNKSINQNYQKYIYVKTIKFTKDLVRTYFSCFFKKLLTYDEDFINIKNLYILTYNKEIKDIDNYGIDYPTKLKNYITNNYSKIFLERDFNFFTDGYFQYSHQYLYNKKYKYKYVIQNKLLFPDKKLTEENDSAHKDISTFIKDLVIYECEMITIKGSIFGNILVFDNCLVFISELNNDKRKRNNKSKDNEDTSYMDYACCSIDYDHLKKYKRIIIEYKEIKEVINRTFFYTWISLEIFLKDGKSYFFNFFNEDTNKDVFEFLKLKKVHYIQKNNEHFKKEEFAKKWKEEKISTFDYLLLLNKLSSRSYNDPNQYPVMPWLFLEEGTNFIRNFDLPISVQDEEQREMYLSKTSYYLGEEEKLSHGNHYSTSAYTFFYLMRVNPFTNNMIRFQSNNFDVPDRQYSDMKQTILLCQKMNNNREMIPELFSIPEIYINLNDNDFGKQKDGTRVHNISFHPYCDNPIQFIYLLKDLLNNSIEVNKQINKFFDYIFGVNQLGNYSNSKKDNLSNKEKEQLKSLRRFNENCYGQLFNMKKLILEGQKKNKSDSELYQDIKNNINISVSFGQCPYQLLTEVHPSKHKALNIGDNSSTISDLSNYSDPNGNLRYNSVMSNKSNKSNSNRNMIIIKKDANFKEIYKIKGSGDIVYFTKSSKSNYLYCLLNNRTFEIYQLDENTKNAFVLIKSIVPKCQLLFYKKTKDNSLIFRPKFIFCEINENIFICCRTLDKTLKYYNYSDNIEEQFILKSYTTCILNINNNEFLTGHDNGILCKWLIDSSNKDKKPKLELLSLLKSNKNSITCLTHNEKLNIIISSDINNMIIRKSHDFEFLVSINIENKDKLRKSIVDVKISEYDFIYAMIFIEDTESYELQGFTLNGTYFGKYSGNISNFQISQNGKIIVGSKDKPILRVLDPVNFTEIFYKMFPISEDYIYYQFYYDKPNVIYFGIKDNDSTRIKILFLDIDDEIYFL